MKRLLTVLLSVVLAAGAASAWAQLTIEISQGADNPTAIAVVPFAFQGAGAPPYQIACTRSFGKPVHQLAPLIEAVSEFAARAAEKLRKQKSLATEMLVFMHTSPYRPGPQCSRSVVVPLRRPTDDTLALTKAATDGMRFMYLAGYQFIKA